MKKVILLAAFVVLCSSLFAQSKTEFKEQLAAVETELAQLKKTDSLNSILYQAKLKSLEEQIASLTSTINTQNAALKNYADQVERQNNEINSLSRLVAIDTALRNSATSSTNASPRQKNLFCSKTNNRFVVPTGKTWVLSRFICVNYKTFGWNKVCGFISVSGTHINNWLADETFVCQEGTVITFDIRKRTDDATYETSLPAPNDAIISFIVHEYDNE